MLPAGAAALRTRLTGAMGENAYKGIFALLLIGAIVLMVFGWKSTEADEFYTAPAWGWVIAGLLMLASSVMFFAPYMANNISRRVRHPQLIAVVLFGVGHLAAVGNTRSLVLFGGLSLWAVIEILLLNRRDGAWEKPATVPRASDFKVLLPGLVFFLVFALTHNYLFGVTPIPT
jgi:uncharacterized membrane protein